MTEVRSINSKEQRSPVNISKTLDYLNRSFQIATRGLPLAQKIRWENPTAREQEGERHYNWQADFAYLLREIGVSPAYFFPKLVTDANQLIEEISKAREVQ